MKRLLLLLAVLVVPRLAAAQTETVEYYGHDAIGSIRIVWDANGTVLGRQDYAPFGKPQVRVPAMPKEGFTAQEKDDETDQAYFHARMFESRTGRFARADPIGGDLSQPQRLNRYAYALNNAITFKDTTGLQTQTVNCGLGAYWCPGAVGTGPPNGSDRYFDPSQYGYHGGEENARAEAIYLNGVALAFQSSSGQGKQPQPNVTTSETFRLASPVAQLVGDVAWRTKGITEVSTYGEFIALSAAGGTIGIVVGSGALAGSANNLILQAEAAVAATPLLSKVLPDGLTQGVMDLIEGYSPSPSYGSSIINWTQMGCYFLFSCPAFGLYPSGG